MDRVLVFDVNETLLDLGALRDPFARAFGDAGAMTEWFLRLLHGSLVETVTGAYQPFGELAGAALDIVAQRQGVALDGEGRREILAGMRALPPHPEVPAALERLGAGGFRLAALTNSTGELASQQLANAGIADRFELVLSVEETRRFKPAPEPYLLAAERLGVSIERIRMVAAHDWDCAGALRAGAAAAFVARPGQVYRAGLPKPDVEGPNLDAVAEAVERADGT